MIVPSLRLKIDSKKKLGFTLVELLIVIAIIAVLAGLLMAVGNHVETKSIIQHAQSELSQIETAIDRYHARYGFYPPSSGSVNSQINPLYYELVGTTTNSSGTGINFTTLDNASSITASTVLSVFNVNAFMNSTRGSGEDSTLAQTFLPGLKPDEIASNGVVSVIVTGANSDSGYLPVPGFTSLNGRPANPWCYTCPGTNNPTSYDLWIQLSVGGKTYLICNWVKNVQVH